MSETSKKSLIVVGPGERLDELSAALGGLLARAPEPGARMMALEDLAQLLLMRAGSGRLLLDADRVPAEDIGILRRFLEDRPGWTLHVVDVPGGQPSPLLGLPKSELLAWEPDLAALRALATPTTPGGSASAARKPAASAAAPPQPAPAQPAIGKPATPKQATPAAGTPAGESCDLSALLDDLIVARALAEGGADYRFEPPGDLRVAAGPEDVASVLSGGLALAEACAGADGQVDVRARADGDTAYVEVVFPPGELTDGDLPALLGNGTLDGPRELVAASKQAREAARLAAQLAGAFELDTHRGKLRLAVRLPLAAQG